MNDNQLAETTPDRVLKGAQIEFAKNSFAGARVDRIARRAGVNKAMIYYYFDSKEGLYQAVIDAHFSLIGETLTVNLGDETDPKVLLRNMAEAYEALFSDKYGFLPIFLQEIATGGERIRKALVKVISEKGLTKRIETLLEDGKRTGIFRDVNSKQAIISFIGMNLIYHLLSPIIDDVWEIGDERKFRKQRPAAVTDLFLLGLIQRKQTRQSGMTAD